jgi:serine/threonine protein phosphatase PrpC
MSIWNSLLSKLGAGSRAASSTVAATGSSRLATSAEFRVEAGVASDPGCVRTNNEDSLRVVRPANEEGLAQHGVLAIVCDGMGGHEAGEVASALAAETIVQRFMVDDRPLPAALVRAIEAANQAINEAVKSNAKLRGMGTTCCALVLRNGAAYCAHVGDSRCYLVRGGEVFLMTEDHSAVMDLVRRGVISRDEAGNHPDRNVISRALGSHPRVEVSAWDHPFTVQPDDAFVLSSDGLHDLVTEAELGQVVGRGDVHAQVACDRLVSMARERGGPDNISVAVLRMRSLGAGARSVPETRTIEAVT